MRFHPKNQSGMIIPISLFLFSWFCVINPAFTQTYWEKFSGNPVLDVGPSGSWEENGVLAQGVFFDGTTYQMWYTGLNSNSIGRLGYATSPDRITWTKYDGNPVLDAGPPDSWDQAGVGSPSVIFDGTTYHMWYDGVDGNNRRIGYATSSDGIAWTKYAANPILDLGPSGTWDDEGVHQPSIIFDGTTYHLWYTGDDGSNSRIGYATSPDRVTWTKVAGNPVMDLGAPGNWDEVAVGGPSVISDGTSYQMWYGGIDASTTGRTGYATSPDGVTWTKFAGNPVMDVGGSGTWDESFAHVRGVIFDGNTYHMWYNGTTAPNFIWRIGYAVDTTTTTSVLEVEGEIPTAFTLEQNYPNPFNPGTTIKYSLGNASNVALTIYNTLGQQVRILVNENQSPGPKSVVWDSKNDLGKPVSSGIYFYTLQTRNRLQMKKMLLLR